MRIEGLAVLAPRDELSADEALAVFRAAKQAAILSPRSGRRRRSGCSRRRAPRRAPRRRAARRAGACFAAQARPPSGRAAPSSRSPTFTCATSATAPAPTPRPDERRFAAESDGEAHRVDRRRRRRRRRHRRRAAPPAAAPAQAFAPPPPPLHAPPSPPPLHTGADAARRTRRPPPRAISHKGRTERTPRCGRSGCTARRSARRSGRRSSACGRCAQRPRNAFSALRPMRSPSAVWSSTAAVTAPPRGRARASSGRK